jgi:hypothetical protein
MAGNPLLLLHVTAGTAGLLLGPVWLVARLARARARARGPAGAYQAAVAGVAGSGAVLALSAPGLGWLLPVAVATQALAVAGALARRQDWSRWRTLQPHLLGGSYIALVTGLLVASTGNPVWWVLPALVGQVPIAVAKRRLHSAGITAPVGA